MTQSKRKGVMKCEFIVDANIKMTSDDIIIVGYNDEYISYDNALIGYYKYKKG